ncbi:amidohydrolase [Rhodococcus sp. D2-41]|uniref:amidohydrolase n=1 Tax=Speluncibacter jeojiensis TaxID=2710754 RepID=UPI00240EE96F|nr:amidohydrolase [Rhodococcus sp. D2-41]MDG3008547.1 amidohydrolase [Rhodococcus sp. D2-41]
MTDSRVQETLGGFEAAADDLVALYRELHANPELSYQEHRTAARVAERLQGAGYQVTAGLGGTGVVGVLGDGSGPVVLLRADMDALPVREDTGLAYASTVTVTSESGESIPVMHACGHDMHVTCLLGAAALMAERRASWSGTLVVLFQPAEELGSGAQAMVDDGLFDTVPRPDVVLGQHVMPGPAGTVFAASGTAMAAARSLQVRMFGRGGHGSMPDATIDPVVMGASTVMRLQTLVSREVSPANPAVLTVGSFQAGTKENVIPDEAVLKLNIRAFETSVAEQLLDGITRIVDAEATASRAPRPPEITELNGFEVTVNDPDATARTLEALRGELGADKVFEIGPVSGSEDVGDLAKAAEVPLVYWFIGGFDPARDYSAEPPASNHSPRFAPVIRPTLDVGVTALVTAALEWLG